MGRILRIDVGCEIYHVLNRGNARNRYPIQIFSYQIMPNHWHFCLSPKNNGDMTKFIQWLTLTHTQRWHAHHRSMGTGHLYQGRYKSFIVQKDNYFLQLCRYIENNALSAKLVQRAEDWRWSSLWRREYGTDKQKEFLSPWPVTIPIDYLDQVNGFLTGKELEYIETSVSKNRPFGDEKWMNKIIKKFGLEITLRQQGRPKKGS